MIFSKYPDNLNMDQYIVNELDIPENPPEPRHPKLATMTVNTEIHTGLNLNIISKYIELTDNIIAIKYEDNIVNETIIRGDKDKAPKGHFQHQSTFIIRLPNPELTVDSKDRLNHMKVFNNGKLGIINCRAREEGDLCAKILLDSIVNISGEMTCRFQYDARVVFNDTSEQKALEKGAKDFEETEIFPKIAEMIGIKLGFLSRLKGRTKKDRLAILSTYFHIKPTQLKKYILVYKLRQLYNIYYTDDFFDEYAKGSGSFRIIENIMSNMNTDNPNEHISKIWCPAYLNYKERLIHDVSNTYIGMINSTCSVRFFMDLEKLFAILRKTNMTVTYKPDDYRAIVCKYYPNLDRDELIRKNIYRRVTLIIFAKGSINITAAVTWRQVQESYDMIVRIIHEHFDTILYKKLYKQFKLEWFRKLARVCKNINEDRTDFLFKKSAIFESNSQLLESYGITRYEDVDNAKIILENEKFQVQNGQ